MLAVLCHSRLLSRIFERDYPYIAKVRVVSFLTLTKHHLMRKEINFPLERRGWLFLKPFLLAAAIYK